MVFMLMQCINRLYMNLAKLLTGSRSSAISSSWSSAGIKDVVVPRCEVKGDGCNESCT